MELRKSGSEVENDCCFTFLASHGCAKMTGSQPVSFISCIFPELACPAVASHLNSGFPKPLAPFGAACAVQWPPSNRPFVTAGNQEVKWRMTVASPFLHRMDVPR